MWAQNWGSLIDLITDFKKEYSLTYYLREKNYTVSDLVKKAEDFYVSLGFKPMTATFWKHSRLGSEAANGSTCHGTAANMFQPHDFRYTFQYLERRKIILIKKRINQIKIIFCIFCTHIELFYALKSLRKIFRLFITKWVTWLII